LSKKIKKLSRLKNLIYF